MSLEDLKEVQRQRDKTPLPKQVRNLFGDKHIKPQYIEHRPATKALQRYHRRAAKKAATLVEDIGIQQAARLPFVGNQISHRYPWAVMWLRGGKRYRKLSTNLWQAVHIRNRLHELGVRNATVVSRARSYYIPVELIGKLPKPWVWCPHCMKPRKFRRVGDETIYALKKTWNEERGRYDEKERLLALIRCPMCGCTNRNQIFRKSNQPFVKRRFKPGTMRASRRKRSKRIKRRR